MLIRVVRPLCIAGRPFPAGEEIEVADNVGYEAISSGRGERVIPAEAGGPMTTKNTGGLVEGEPAATAEPADDESKESDAGDSKDPPKGGKKGGHKNARK